MLLTFLTILILADLVQAQDNPDLSIYDIQYTEEPTGESYWNYHLVNCTGGIVTHKFPGYKPKLTVQDPNFPLGWGAIQVKDGLTGAPLYAKASVGDWIRLTNVEVEEYRGNTILQCLPENSPALTVVSSNNPLPKPLLVEPNEITAPLEGPAGQWFVADHNAEKYEAMWLKVRNVTVTEKGLGKKIDNYTLQDCDKPNDSNFSCWAADYMNEDKEEDEYHPYIELDRHFCSVEGILEQYTKISNGWDYYQLLTTTTEDFNILQTADFDDDCDVDFSDFSLFAQHWLEDGCDEPGWCGGADLTQNGNADISDLRELVRHWLDGRD